jgi:hypothetical protein
MDRAMGAEQRKSPRNKTYAKVILEGGGELGYLRDLSREGCQIAFIGKPLLDRGAVVEAEVIPSEEMGIARFWLSMQVLWTRNDPVYYTAGGLINSVQDRERFEQLFRYYSGDSRYQ